MSDLTCRVAELYVHPLKSCGAMAVGETLLLETGFDLDRQWMVVDSDGDMLTQRELPRMALIAPSIRYDEVVLRAPGMLALHLSIERVEAATRVRVWDDEVRAYDMGALAAQWLSDFLGRKLRLVRFDPEQVRPCNKRWTGAYDAQTGFADGFPLLVTSLASLAELNRRLAAAGAPAVDSRRFRPNLVLDGVQAFDEDHIGRLHIDTEEGPVVLELVKPCVRCTIPNVDPLTAATDPAVGDMLASWRADARMNGGVTFGMNAIAVEGIERTLRVGQTARASFRF